MIRIGNHPGLIVEKNRFGFFKADAVFLDVGFCLGLIPFKVKSVRP
jgi:hypothetical protein